jgi:hypothetical protein
MAGRSSAAEREKSSEKSQTASGCKPETFWVEDRKRLGKVRKFLDWRQEIAGLN